MRRLLPLCRRVWMAHVRYANFESTKPKVSRTCLVSGKASHRCFVIGRLTYVLPVATWIWHCCNEMVMKYYTNIHASTRILQLGRGLGR